MASVRFGVVSVLLKATVTEPLETVTLAALWSWSTNTSLPLATVTMSLAPGTAGPPAQSQFVFTLHGPPVPPM